ncbi:MAG: hypothetical protein ACI8Z5_002100 [Lentimonas sp.]|jgi:hypothetical protein
MAIRGSTECHTLENLAIFSLYLVTGKPSISTDDAIAPVDAADIKGWM